MGFACLLCGIYGTFFFFAHCKTVPSRERLLFLVMKTKALPMRISTCAAEVSTIAEAH